MRYLTAGKLVCAVWLLTLLQVSCLSDDRCGKGYKYKDNSCFKVTAKKPVEDASASSEDAATDRDGGDGDSGEVAATGFGDSCTDDTQCKGKTANYCALNPQTPGKGSCTIKGCTSTPESCPGDYRCCKLPDSFGGALCLDATQYQTANSAGMCGK
jgi:hypothetical protein